jgi:uncharacterized protein YbaA (DUF1428 family)
MRYVDGFLLAVPKKNLAAYRDDLKVKMGVPFPKQMRLKPSETAVFSWIVYKSRAHRDAVNKKIMKDPRITGMCDPKHMPFDMKRMCYGGFKVLVDGQA